MMNNIAIIGGGVIGVTTAYILAERGHSVDLFEREADVALGCSYANGGQLSFNHVEPWASPAMLKKAFSWLLRDDAPLVFKPSLDPALLKFLVRFVTAARDKNVQSTTQTMLALGLLSRQHFLRLKEIYDFGKVSQGIMHIYRDQKSLDGGAVQAEFQRKFGSKITTIAAQQCLEHEPALHKIGDQIVGGMIFEDDIVLDSYRFTQTLKTEAEKLGVRFHFNSNISKLICKNNKIVGMISNGEEITADKYILAIASNSNTILSPLGINLPIYPMIGYSISVKIGNNSLSPRHAITDHSSKIVYADIGGTLRAAGTAQLGRDSAQITEKRMNYMKNSLMEIFPDCGDIDNAKIWRGVRPATPTGIPITSASHKYNNLYFNTGHGTLGLTMSLGSASVMSDLIEAR